MSKEITTRQRELLDNIVVYFKVEYCLPTIRDLGASMDISSTNGVVDHLNALYKKGYLYSVPGKRPCYRFTNKTIEEYNLEFKG